MNSKGKAASNQVLPPVTVAGVLLLQWMTGGKFKLCDGKNLVRF